MLKINTKESQPLHFEAGLIGSLDTASAPQLEEFLKGVFGNHARSLRLDLAQLDYICSTGLRLLMSAAKHFKQSGGVYTVANPQPPVRKVIDIAKALPSETVFASAKEEERYFDDMQKKVPKHP
ncbi:MAG: STAS domain-containing protein [Verrucomicrobiia bacterium]